MKFVTILIIILIKCNYIDSICTTLISVDCLRCVDEPLNKGIDGYAQQKVRNNYFVTLTNLRVLKKKKRLSSKKIQIGKLSQQTITTYNKSFNNDHVLRVITSTSFYNSSFGFSFFFCYCFRLRLKNTYVRNALATKLNKNT